jgi:carboxyl-terminal processing protease
MDNLSTNNKSQIPKVKFHLVRNILLVVFLVSVAFGVGYFFGFKGFVANYKQYPKVTITRETPPDKTELDFSLFWRVWDTLDAKYFDKDKLIPAQMVYGAIKGMVAAVGDPYTVFLPPSENKVVEEDLQGEFQGVGIQIGFKGTQLAVIAPLPDSPAEKAGVKAGDLIVGIKDELKDIDRGTVGITLPDAVKAIRGPAGSKVSLMLLRDGSDEPINTEITRASIDVPSITLVYPLDTQEQPDESVVQIKVLKFAAETTSEWDDAVAEVLKNPDVKYLIVDVRNNPGGYLQAAVDLASDFLETGDTVVIEEDGSGTQNEYRVEKLGRLRDIKMAVLINEGSASASEIFAGALQDHNRAEIVGSTSFGKGTIQEPEQIDHGAGLHITVAKWLTPDGNWVNEKGITPDEEVEENSDTPNDEQLDKAIEVIS